MKETNSSGALPDNELHPSALAAQAVDAIEDLSGVHPGFRRTAYADSHQRRSREL
ncbi:hypothetical protein [Paenibacillus sp. IHBB 3054]|uniref:hypothetical protein n=1 Tax=Paenibacillus sp. IHBB 3054 TaxID=3425689 RepID=UPI003F663582